MQHKLLPWCCTASKFEIALSKGSDNCSHAYLLGVVVWCRRELRDLSRFARLIARIRECERVVIVVHCVSGVSRSPADSSASRPHAMCRCMICHEGCNAQTSWMVCDEGCIAQASSHVCVFTCHLRCETPRARSLDYLGGFFRTLFCAMQTRGCALRPELVMQLVCQNLRCCESTSTGIRDRCATLSQNKATRIKEKLVRTELRYAKAKIKTGYW